MKRTVRMKGFLPVFRIHDILVWIRIRIRGSMPLTNGSGSTVDSDPDPAIFVINLQDANKKIHKKVFLLITFGRYIYIIFQR
jgi:hypothetical protein